MLCFEVFDLQISPQFSTPYLIHILWTIKVTFSMQKLCHSVTDSCFQKNSLKFQKYCRLIYLTRSNVVKLHLLNLPKLSSKISFIQKKKKKKMTSCFRHCMKSVHIRSFSGPHFPAFGLNTETEIYYVNLRIQYKCGKKRTRKSANKSTFNPVRILP